MAGDARSLASWAWQLFAGKVVTQDSLAIMANVDGEGHGLGLDKFTDFGSRGAYGYTGSKPGSPVVIRCFSRAPRGCRCGPNAKRRQRDHDRQRPAERFIPLSQQETLSFIDTPMMPLVQSDPMRRYRDRADPAAASGQFSPPPAGSFVAAYGQFLVAVVSQPRMTLRRASQVIEVSRLAQRDALAEHYYRDSWSHPQVCQYPSVPRTSARRAAARASTRRGS